MNWLDIVIIVIAAVFGLVGLWRGAIRTAFGIAGLVLGIILAGRCYQPFAALLSPGGASWAGIAAYAIILIATMIVAGVIGWIVAKLVHITLLGWLDRLVGGILGVGIGLLLVAAMLAIVSKYLPGSVETISQSALARFLIERFPLLLALLPEEFDFIHDLFSPSGQIN